MGKILNITLKRISGKWYISFATMQEVEKPIHPSKTSIGVDLGVKKLATTSNGEVFLPKNSFN
jgi:putative transposase